MIFYISNRENMYQDIPFTDLESSLIKCPTFQRLKHLSETGAVAMITTLKHSRFQSAVGLLKLTAHFFEDNQLYRLAGLLYHTTKNPISPLGNCFCQSQDLNPYFFNEDIQAVIAASPYQVHDILTIIKTSPMFAETQGQMTLPNMDQCLRESERIKNPSVDAILSGVTCDLTQGCLFNETASAYMYQRLKAALAYRYSLKARMVEACMERAIQLYQSLNRNQSFGEIDVHDDKTIIAALKKSPSQDIQTLFDMIYDSTMKIKAKSKKYYKHKTTLFDPRGLKISYPIPYKDELDQVYALLDMLHEPSFVYLP